jgi:hypothetical protein
MFIELPSNWLYGISDLNAMSDYVYCSDWDTVEFEYNTAQDSGSWLEIRLCRDSASMYKSTSTRPARSRSSQQRVLYVRHGGADSRDQSSGFSTEPVARMRLIDPT